MKPPSKDAIYCAAGVIAEQIGFMGEGDPDLPKLRSVRAWLLGSQLPIAERRERAARSREADRQTRLVRAVAEPTAFCPDCGELLMLDHSVCFSETCIASRAKAERCDQCGNTLAHVAGPGIAPGSMLCPECDREHLDELLEPDDHGSECRCEQCAAKPILPRGGPFFVVNERDRQRAAETLTPAEFDDEIPFGLGPAIRELAASQGKTITRIGAPRKKK